MVMQIRRTATPNNPPATLAEGQLAVEMANPLRLWIGVPVAVDPSGRKQLLPNSSIASGTTPPATGNSIGDLFYNTATDTLLVWNGTAWDPVAPPAGVATNPGAAAPGTPVVGMLWFNTTTSELMVWNGTTWSAVSAPSAATIGVTFRAFTTTGLSTYTTPADASPNTIYHVRMVGGGSGGNYYATGNQYNAGAGGGGEYKEFVIAGIAANTAINLNVGTGGAGGTSGGTQRGLSGGNTTFTITPTGTTVVCNAGQGPLAGNWYYMSGLGGRGGATTPGTANLSMLLLIGGQDGQQVPNEYLNAVGGNSAIGLGAQADAASQGLQASSGYGSGGRGGANWSPNGGAGTAGCVIIQRFQG